MKRRTVWLAVVIKGQLKATEPFFEFQPMSGCYSPLSFAEEISKEKHRDILILAVSGSDYQVGYVNDDIRFETELPDLLIGDPINLGFFARFLETLLNPDHESSIITEAKQRLDRLCIDGPVQLARHGFMDWVARIFDVPRYTGSESTAEMAAWIESVRKAHQKSATAQLEG